MSTYSLLVEIKTALDSIPGITKVYDLLIPPSETSEAKSPYICIGELQLVDGRVLDDGEHKAFVDLCVWTKYKGKKKGAEIFDKIEKKFSSMPRPYWVENSLFDYDSDSGWSLTVVTLRTYLDKE